MGWNLRKNIESLTTGEKSEIRILYLIILVAILYYLPFVSRQFMGDDWLWLANAKGLFSNPHLLFERPMYGYFRPFNLLWIFILFSSLGPKAYLFSFINIILHAINIFLMWKVLRAFQLPSLARIIATTFFAFYFLNASALGWISVGHDIWVLLLTFLFILAMRKFILKPKLSMYALVLFFGFAATFFKEAGFITLGLFLLMIVMFRRNPLSRKFIVYSLVAVLLYGIYLIYYFQTRTFADRELDLGLGFLINIWYFLAYLITPFSYRFVEMVPQQYHPILKVIKIGAIIMVPLALIFIARVRDKAAILLSLLSIMFISTIAIINWHVGLFDIYPARTASRFMYLAVPGLAVIIGLIAQKLTDRVFSRKTLLGLLIFLTPLFILANWLIMNKVTALFHYNQEQCNQIIASLGEISQNLESGDTLLILTDDLEKTPSVVKDGIFVKAILFVIFDLSNEVSILESDTSDNAKPDKERKNIILFWDTKLNRFRMRETTI